MRPGSVQYFARHSPAWSTLLLFALLSWGSAGCAESGLEGEDASGASDTSDDGQPPGGDAGPGGDGGTDADTGDLPVDSTGDSDDSPGDADEGDGVGGCGGDCGSGEICRDGSCVDACGTQGAECGTVEVEGTEIQCGSCGSDAFCSKHSKCRDICQAAGAECGSVFWGGKTADCGSCSGDCYHNRCASSGYRSIAGGHQHSCATDDGGALYCWGGDLSGQLGNGSDGESLTPVQLSASGTALEVRSLRFHSCATLASGSLLCWGANNDGQVGNGSTDTLVESPATVSQIGQGADVAVGNLHSCAALDGGDGRCWGAQAFGRLGNGQNSSGSRRTPVAVEKIGDAVEIVAAGSHSCALLSDGTVQCWGNGSEGRLGNGTFSGSATPVEVVDLEGVVDIGAGIKHTCAVTQDGDVWCWGFGGDYQLGHGAASNEPVPVEVQQLDDAVAVVGGASHTCARTAGGEVRCWGANQVTDSNGMITAGGQLGDGSFQDSKTPVSVSSSSGGGTLQDVMALGAGRRHTCAVTVSGDAYCWGTNNDGQVGDGTTDNRTTPVGVQ